MKTTIYICDLCKKESDRAFLEVQLFVGMIPSYITRHPKLKCDACESCLDRLGLSNVRKSVLNAEEEKNKKDIQAQTPAERLEEILTDMVDYAVNLNDKS